MGSPGRGGIVSLRCFAYTISFTVEDARHGRISDVFIISILSKSQEVLGHKQAIKKGQIVTKNNLILDLKYPISPESPCSV